jgi:hypothetical protein
LCFRPAGAAVLSCSIGRSAETQFPLATIAVAAQKPRPTTTSQCRWKFPPRRAKFVAARATHSQLPLAIKISKTHLFVYYMLMQKFSALNVPNERGLRAIPI